MCLAPSPAGDAGDNRLSSGPGARSASVRVAARPREREPGALAVLADQGDSKHPGDFRNRGNAIASEELAGRVLSVGCVLLCLGRKAIAGSGAGLVRLCTWGAVWQADDAAIST
jgi:hypothetical protein